MHIGLRIRAARLKAGVTQEELCKYLNVSQPQLARWETCKVRPHQKHVAKIKEYLDINDPSLYKVNLEFHKNIYKIDPWIKEIVETYMDLDRDERPEFLKSNGLNQNKIYNMIREYKSKKMIQGHV